MKSIILILSLFIIASCGSDDVSADCIFIQGFATTDGEGQFLIRPDTDWTVYDNTTTGEGAQILHRINQFRSGSPQERRVTLDDFPCLGSGTGSMQVEVESFQLSGTQASTSFRTNQSGTVILEHSTTGFDFIPAEEQPFSASTTFQTINFSPLQYNVLGMNGYVIYRLRFIDSATGDCFYSNVQGQDVIPMIVLPLNQNPISNNQLNFRVGSAGRVYIAVVDECFSVLYETDQLGYGLKDYSFQVNGSQFSGASQVRIYFHAVDFDDELIGIGYGDVPL